MEEELKCPICRRLYTNPVLLPCSHSVCLQCAVNAQMPAQQLQDQAGSEDGSSQGSGGGGSTDLDPLDVDKLSLMSETDSGVVVSSRPNSYVGTPSFGSQFFHILQGNSLGINCPSCKRNIYLDDQGANGLPKNRVLESIVDKYVENKNLLVHCQLCETKSSPANLMCEQCEVFYCDECKENCHPDRGPLALHNLVAPSEGKVLLRAKHKSKDSKCSEHVDENISLYCVLCKTTVCCVCVQDGRHINHDVQPLGAMCKSQKQELSQLLQSLSEKAKSGTEFIQRLKSMEGHIEDNKRNFEAKVVAQCDALIEAIRKRKKELLDTVAQERKHKERSFREQVADCTKTLQKTMGLLQFSIEALKEPDATAFLQVSNQLVGRVGGVEQVFNKDMELVPRMSSDFELSLDDSLIHRLIRNLNFFQMKAPDSPQFIMDECGAENNTVTLAWQSRTGTVVDGYTLELDDGSEGDFREVYTGKETMCTVEGLHFDSMYNARVKGFNHAGESDYSDSICLQTTPVAWFTMDPSTSHPDVIFSNENTTITSKSCDDVVALGHVGFSRGVHYWEITIDRYENTPDPAFGIARFDVDKHSMLGKDEKGWSMYIDMKRSWFMHRGQHSARTEGGVQNGSVIGVLLDLNNQTLTYLVDHVPHGPIAFTGLSGVYYPAVSLNRNVQVTIHTGVEVPPPETDTEED